jgi:hypothetical protein
VAGALLLEITLQPRDTRSLKHFPVFRPTPLWKGIWNSKTLPKVDMFIWTLDHNNILTGENIKKKGWEGPTRCSLCCQQEESTNHLLLSYPFAKEVQNFALSPWSNQVNLSEEIQALLSNWDKMCPFTIHKKDWLNYCWMSLSKFTFWMIWLE